MGFMRRPDHEVSLLQEEDGQREDHDSSLGRLVSSSWVLWKGSRGPLIGTKCAMELA